MEGENKYRGQGRRISTGGRRGRISTGGRRGRISTGDRRGRISTGDRRGHRYRGIGRERICIQGRIGTGEGNREI